MGLGNISRQSPQSTSTNVQKQTNSKNDDNLSPNFGFFAGRKMVENKIEAQIIRINELNAAKARLGSETHIVHRGLHTDEAKREMTELNKLKNRVVYILNGTNQVVNDATKDAGDSTLHKTSAKWSRKYNLENIDKSLEDAKGLKKLVSRAERGMKSYYNQTIPTHKLAKFSNKLGAKLENLDKIIQKGGIEPFLDDF